MDPAKEIEKLKEFEKQQKSYQHGMSILEVLTILFFICLLAAGAIWLVGGADEPDPSGEFFYPTPIVTSPWSVTQQLQPTPTLAPTRPAATDTPAPSSTAVPTQTPWPTHTPWPTLTAAASWTPQPTHTAAPTWTPQPTHTPYPTLTAVPTWTPTAAVASPTATPTYPPPFVPVQQPTPNIVATLLADEIMGVQRQLLLGTGVLLALFLGCLLLLAWGLAGSRRPALNTVLSSLQRELAAWRQMLAAAWGTADGATPPPTPPSPTRQQLPPPTRPPVREQRRVVESSESSRRVEPVEPVELEPVQEVQLPFSKERAPNVEEKAYMRRRYAETGSLTAVCMECYDSKGGKVWAWVKEAVEGQEVGQGQEVGPAAPPRPHPFFVTTTSRGREAL